MDDLLLSSDATDTEAATADESNRGEDVLGLSPTTRVLRSFDINFNTPLSSPGRSTNLWGVSYNTRNQPLSDAKRVVDAKKSKAVTISIEGTADNGDKVVMVCSDCDKLTERSEYFKELINNIYPSVLNEDSETEMTITLLEDDVFEASGLLSELLKREKNSGGQVRSRSSPPVISWNQSWAKLSAKWMLMDYVEAYAELGQNCLKRTLAQNNAATLTIQGSKASGHLKFVNGIYDQTNKMNDGQRVYKKRGDSNWWLCFNLSEHRWEVRSNDRCYAYVTCTDAVSPELCNEIWKILDFSTGEWQSCLSISVRRTLTDKPITSDDVVLFWEVVEVLMTHCAYQIRPAFDMPQLLDALIKHKELWSKEYMKNLLSKQDFIMLCELLKANSYGTSS